MWLERGEPAAASQNGVEMPPVGDWVRRLLVGSHEEKKKLSPLSEKAAEKAEAFSHQSEETLAPYFSSYFFFLSAGASGGCRDRDENVEERGKRRNISRSIRCGRRH